MEQINFRKDFEALHQISMKMADTCIVKNSIQQRTAKLEEEFAELMEQLTQPSLNIEEVKGELGDVLFVLLHIAHTLKITPFQLLHQASTKMLGRMADDTYKAKN